MDSKGQPRNYGGLYKTKIGLITVDELNMGGLSYAYSYVSDQNYLRRSYNYWTITPQHSDFDPFVFYAGSFGAFEEGGANNSGAVVPVINLKTDNITYSGSGIDSDPIQIS